MVISRAPSLADSLEVRRETRAESFPKQVSEDEKRAARGGHAQHGVSCDDGLRR